MPFKLLNRSKAAPPIPEKPVAEVADAADNVRYAPKVKPAAPKKDYSMYQQAVTREAIIQIAAVAKAAFSTFVMPNKKAIIIYLKSLPEEQNEVKLTYAKLPSKIRKNLKTVISSFPAQMQAELQDYRNFNVFAMRGSTIFDNFRNSPDPDFRNLDWVKNCPSRQELDQQINQLTPSQSVLYQTVLDGIVQSIFEPQLSQLLANISGTIDHDDVTQDHIRNSEIVMNQALLAAKVCAIEDFYPSKWTQKKITQLANSIL